MDLSEIFEVHRRSKTKVNLFYQRDSGRIGHCYIDPTKPLRRGSVTRDYGYVVDTLNDLIAFDPDTITIGVFKQINNVEIFVKPKNLWVHSKHKESIIKILYGKS